MRLPVITGLIKRRLLINFRADPEITRLLLPPGLRPKVHGSNAIVGICLIRLEQIRPKGLPASLGLSSENAAHRIAVEWTENGGQPAEGVFIPRRDTDSSLNVIAGGRIFPGVHHHSHFAVDDNGNAVSISMESGDSEAGIDVSGAQSDVFPPSSCFASLEESSDFFKRGCVGYSTTRNAARLDGLELSTQQWEVQPLDVSAVQSGFFADVSRFPKGSIEFDHGLIMRNIQHEWISLPAFHCDARP